MGVRSGSLTFTRFFVRGQPPRGLRNRYLEAVGLRTFEPLKIESEASEACGWCALGRPFDLDISLDKLFEDRYLLLGFRVDRWTIPGTLLSSHLAEEERAWLAKSKREKLNRRERTELKQRVIQKLRRKVLPISRAFDVCWDLDTGTVLFFTHSARLLTDFTALFEKTFGLPLIEDSPYCAAQRAKLPDELEREFSRVEPMRLAHHSKNSVEPRKQKAQPTSEPPAPTSRSQNRSQPHPTPVDLPDLLERTESTRFLGPEFMLWVWLRAELLDGSIALGTIGDFEIWLDNQLTFESSLDPKERVTVRGAAPSASPEAREAVRAHKFPVRARLVMQGKDQDFACVLHGTRLAISAGAIPAVLTERSDDAFLERMHLIDTLVSAVDLLYGQFLHARLSPTWLTGWEPATAAWLESGVVPAPLLQQLVANSNIESSRKKVRSSQRKAR